jgi:hypothetical protein
LVNVTTAATSVTRVAETYLLVGEGNFSEEALQNRVRLEVVHFIYNYHGYAAQTTTGATALALLLR